MPDVSCQYTLTTSLGTIVFNDDSADQFYITEIPAGLAGPPLTLGVDPVAFGDNSVSYTAWTRGRQIQIEGVFLITSTRIENNILTIRNQMEKALRDCLAGARSTPGTLAWQPLGDGAYSLGVKYNGPLECIHDQGYLVRTFSFGLFSDVNTF